MTTLWTAYLGAMRSYLVFEGRSTRAHFFGYVAIVMLIAFAAAIGDRVFIKADRFNLMLGLTIAAHAIPTLAIVVRRLHDIDLPGGVLLIGLVPYLGWIVLFIMSIAPTTPGANRYQGSSSAPKPSTVASRTDLSKLGWQFRRWTRGLSSSWLATSQIPPGPLPEPPASLAIELGLTPVPAPPKQPEDASKRLVRLDLLRQQGMLSEAEFIRLLREGK
jgi:uncharacterized membrane protein YhaH (DUF805 family)